MHNLNVLLHRLFMRLQRFLGSIDRIGYVTAFCVGFGLLILWTTFKYTVFEYEYYKSLADKQQTITVKNPVSRGTIYSSNDPVGVFATSTDLPDLAVDPKAPGSKEKLVPFLVDTVYLELCGREKAANEKCIEHVLEYLKFNRNDEVQYSSEILRAMLRDELKRRISKEFIDFVLVKENLPTDELREIEAFAYSGVTLISGNIYIDPTSIKDPDFVSAKLQTILGMTKADMDAKVSKRPLRYVKILRRMSLGTKDYIDARVIDEKSATSKGLMVEQDTIFPFLILEPHPTRFYPEKSMGGQITGFVDNEHVGRYGVEAYFNDYLQGQEGERQTRKDAAGRTIWGYDLGEKKIVNGADIKLTIDRNIQKEVTRLLAESINEFRANKGSVVILDPKSGGVIAMVNYPDFDPNSFGDVYQIEKVSYARYPNPAFDLLGMPVFVEDSVTGEELNYLGKKIKLRLATEREMGNIAVTKYKYKDNFGPANYQNDAISSLYEPGSVFKAITVAVGLDTGDIKPTDTYLDKGFVEIDKYKIKNISSECLGRNTYAHALDWSCNVGMIDIAQKIGKALFYKYIMDFGFGAKTNITLDGEVHGKLPPYEKWSRTDLFTASFGQGLITATPLQMAAAYVALANGGVYYQPYIVDSITFGDGRVVKNAPTPLRRVIKEETSKKIVAMLTEGASIGFAKKGWVEGYDTAGKTGTSQIASKGKYEEGSAGHTITSYGWFAPASNPKYVMIVKIDRPRSAQYSETTSSALFSRISKYLLNYYGIPKNQ